MRWTASSKDITKELWYRLSPLERYKATRFWINQNMRHGHMQHRAAVKRMRRALRQKRINPPPITSMSKMNLLAFDYKENSLLQAFYPDRRKFWKVGGRRKSTISKDFIRVFPVSEFSLFEDPKKVFETLIVLCIMEAQAPPMHIDFPDDRVRDIGAYLLFSILYQKMVPFAEGGQMKPKIAKVLKAVGLSDAMRISVPSKGFQDVFPLSLQTQSTANMDSLFIGKQTSRNEKVSASVVEKISEWLDSVGVQISEEILSPLGKAVGEVLNNAERHAREDGPKNETGGWWLAGFMARRENADGTFRHVCHLSVVGLGRTIPETLLNSSSNNPRFHPQHQTYKNAGGKNLNDEQRAMVLALTDGITSGDDQSGGLGMGELLAGFAKLGDGKGREKACLAIVSGRTCIRVHHHHISTVDNKGRRKCWLNQSNDASLPPDENSVTDIGMFFPGTCISLRFELDQAHLKSFKVNKSDNIVLKYSVSDAIWKAT